VISAATATTVERQFAPIIGLARTKHALTAAEAVMAGAGQWRIQHINTPAGVPYMRRHFISQRYDRPQVWVHEILLPDEDAFPHDHPWDYRTVLLEGAYEEETPKGSASYEQGDHLARSAESLHRLHLTSPLVTLFMTPRARRQWGFMTDRGWVDAPTYLSQREHDTHDALGRVSNARLNDASNALLQCDSYALLDTSLESRRRQRETSRVKHTSYRPGAVENFESSGRAATARFSYLSPREARS
jgi:hypothetical protein